MRCDHAPYDTAGCISSELSPVEQQGKKSCCFRQICRREPSLDGVTGVPPAPAPSPPAAAGRIHPGTRAHCDRRHVGPKRVHRPLEHLVLVESANSGLDQSRNGLLRCDAEPIVRAVSTETAHAGCPKGSRHAGLASGTALSHRVLRQDAPPTHGPAAGCPCPMAAER